MSDYSRELREFRGFVHGYKVDFDTLPALPQDYIKINGLTRFWGGSEQFSIADLIQNILVGVQRGNITFIITGNGKETSIYIGVTDNQIVALRSSFDALFPGIDTEYCRETLVDYLPLDYNGIFKGVPTDMGHSSSYNNIDALCRGMRGQEFCYIVIAQKINDIDVLSLHEKIHNKMNGIYPQIERSTVDNHSSSDYNKSTVQTRDFACKSLFEALEQFENSLNGGIINGMWEVYGLYGANDPATANRLRSNITACFSGNDSIPFPFHATAPAGTSSQYYSNGTPDITTQLNSRQLAILCQLPTTEFPGCYIDEYVEFDTADRNVNEFKEPVEIGEIRVAGRTDSLQKNHYLFEKNDLTRHALIIGATGGGKTNTSKSLLNTLWNASPRTPFLVIESAKREYWELRNMKGFENLLVFTLGSEENGRSVRYRINPFEVIEGNSLQTHIDYLLSTFKAAFELYPPMPYILETSVYEIYTDRGWNITANTCSKAPSFPTLEDLYNKIPEVTKRLNYADEIRSNVIAALQARTNSLMTGGKGAMMNTEHSTPISMLLNSPVVMELEDIGDDETKSFVIGILLVQLYEYRRSQMTAGSKSLSHILLIEEAHRLLKNVPASAESSTQAKSVEFFCNMLAEIRTYGQGIIIADQIPTKLAADTIKNTNLKIVHRTVAQEDRETIGRAMNMNEAQINYLSSLRRGFAAVYAEGDNRPKCVKMPLMKQTVNKNRREIISEINAQLKQMGIFVRSTIDSTTSGCSNREVTTALEQLKKLGDLKNYCSLLAATKYKHDSFIQLHEFLKDKNITFSNDDVYLQFIDQLLTNDPELSGDERRRIIASENQTIGKKVRL